MDERRSVAQSAIVSDFSATPVPKQERQQSKSRIGACAWCDRDRIIKLSADRV